jgi:hypothetical protein
MAQKLLTSTKRALAPIDYQLQTVFAAHACECTGMTPSVQIPMAAAIRTTNLMQVHRPNR